MKLIVLLAGVAATAMYGAYLEHSPIYLSHDEVVNALNGHSIASTGRDPNGRFLPLYFYIFGNYWAQPIVTYATALVLKVLPLSEVAIRLPSVVVGLASVGLMYAVARRIFTSTRLAVIAAVLLALTPAHFIHSRLAVDHLYPVPFVLGWLLCLAIFLDSRRLGALCAATLLLGIGFYTYVASMVMMPVYLLMTWLTLSKTHQKSPRPYLVALLGFVLPLVVLVPWHLAHPEQYMQQVRMYDLYDSTTLSPAQGVQQMLSGGGLVARVDAYYSSFSPSMLFFSGGSSLINGTRQAGVFLLPVAILLPVGMYRIVTRRLTPMTLVLLLGFVSAPLAASMVAEVYVNRMLTMLPFAILLSTFGVEHLLTAAHRISRVIGVVVLLLVPVQFHVFYTDYMGNYRIRSNVWFEHNIRGAIEAILSRERRIPTPAIYLSDDEVQWIAEYWKFYLVKHRREDLLDRTVYFGAASLEPGEIPAGAVVLTNARGPLNERLGNSGALRPSIVIHEPNDQPSFVIFER